MFTAVADCGGLGNPEGGVVSVSETTYDSMATYSCNPRHTLIMGDEERTCQSSGVWSGNEPICMGKQQIMHEILHTDMPTFHFIHNMCVAHNIFLLESHVFVSVSHTLQNIINSGFIKVELKVDCKYIAIMDTYSIDTMCIYMDEG